MVRVSSKKHAFFLSKKGLLNSGIHLQMLSLDIIKYFIYQNRNSFPASALNSFSIKRNNRSP